MILTYIDIEQLSKYKVDYLKHWLIFRGDTLHGIDTLKDAQVRVLHYIENNTASRIVDPTPEKLWIRKKAEKLGIILTPLWKEGTLPLVPNALKADISNTLDLAGWSKSLEGMPNFTVTNITNYHTCVNNTFCKNSTAIKKHFIRGDQFIEEKFIDTTNIYVKQDDLIFCLKGVAAASLKKANRWVFLAINKNTSDIIYAYCQCPAGRAGTCSHAYALMKLLAKWVVDRLSMVPEAKACTSKPCLWNVPQARDQIEKISVMDLKIKSPTATKQKKGSDEIDNRVLKETKGIVSSLYEPRAVPTTAIINDDLNVLLSHMQNTPTNICATKLINSNPVSFRQTRFGKVASGSFLSYQCPLMPPDFTVYCSINTASQKNDRILFKQYPCFPFQQVESTIDEYVKQIHIVELKKMQLLQELRTHSEAGVEIEARTRNQADNPEWFSYRKNRFTASLCNKFGKNAPKTEKGLKTLAHNILTWQKKSKQDSKNENGIWPVS